MAPYCFVSLYWLATMQATMADLAFGHAQVEQFMRDRPEVKPVLLREVALRNKLEWGFGGLETGFRVYWENQSPEIRQATYHARDDGTPAHVRVFKDQSASGADKCVMLVIELEHAKSESRHTAYRKMAYFGQISREDYALSMTRMEFQSVQRAREFFKQHPLSPPDASYSYDRVLKFPTEFSDYLKSIPDIRDPNSNLVESWRRDYDDLVARRKYDGSELIPTR